MTAVNWRDWAPPLSPPADPGLPEDTAERIAAQHEDEDPHCLAAAQWEAYAATLPPAPPVASVSTGVQSVQYAAGHAGELGAALARADWHRERCGGTLQSVPLLPTRKPRAPWLPFDHGGLAAKVGRDPRPHAP